MLVRQLIVESARQLQAAGCDAPRRDAELLLMSAWGISPTALMIRMPDEVPLDIALRFNDLLLQRLSREPLAYIFGEKEFWSLSFQVSKDVLVPRPETEHLIEQVLHYCSNRDAPLHIADIGTGSGCIAVSLAHEYAHAQVLACDISQAAIAMAKTNASKHGVLERMDFYVGDLYQALPKDVPLDVIVSNPPYVSAAEMLHLAAELSFEPRLALTDESTGLTLLEKLLTDAHLHLKPSGLLVLESGLCGMPKAPPTMKKLADYHDLAGNFRGTVFQRLA